MSLRAKALLPILAFPLLWPLGNSAQAQSSNSDPCGDGSGVGWPDRGIGVCNLEDTTKTYFYDSGFITQAEGFSVRSCTGFFVIFGAQCNTPLGFSVQVDGPSNGSNFILSNAGGIQAPIDLIFSSSGLTESLTPNLAGTESFPGAAGLPQREASLIVSLVSGGLNLLPGSYTGLFQLSLLQDTATCLFCSNTELSPINFTIELIVESKIRISGLSDMAIDANPSGLTEAQQTFCVYSQGGAPFGITATSGNGNGSFLLAGNVDQVRYETWVESLSAGDLEQLAEGRPSNLSWPGSLWDGCTGSGENMQISIRIQQNALANAVETSYTDTLTLTVELN